MTRRNSPNSADADLLDGLLQKYEDAAVNVHSQKTVIKAYSNIADMSAVAEVVNARQDLLLMAFEQQASIGVKVFAEFTMKVQKLKELNSNLTEKNSPPLRPSTSET